MMARYHVSYRGSNHPCPLERVANDACALNRAFVALCLALTVLFIIADQSFSRVERANEIARRV
jgi:hypothetical protein